MKEIVFALATGTFNSIEKLSAFRTHHVGGASFVTTAFGAASFGTLKWEPVCPVWCPHTTPNGTNALTFCHQFVILHNNKNV